MSNLKPTLVILAAGMGSRYGGLKQIDTFTPEGDTIIDFSLYDALQAGFGKFVFIIRKSYEKEFKEIFNKKLKNKAEISYVFQEIENVSEKYINSERKRPWGTGHALLMTEYAVKENFAIINGDDFYGKEAFEVMAKSLSEKDVNSYEFTTMAYLLKNTVSEHGYVSRGECLVNDKSFLVDVTERTCIEKNGEKIVRKDDDGNVISIEGNTVVSMNFWGFTPRIYEYTGAQFESFLEMNSENLKAEFYIANIVSELLKSNTATVEVLKSDAKWFGVTYKEDKELVQEALEELKSQKVYPRHLW